MLPNKILSSKIKIKIPEISTEYLGLVSSLQPLELKEKKSSIYIFKDIKLLGKTTKNMLIYSYFIWEIGPYKR